MRPGMIFFVFFFVVVVVIVVVDLGGSREIRGSPVRDVNPLAKTSIPSLCLESAGGAVPMITGVFKDPRPRYKTLVSVSLDGSDEFTFFVLRLRDWPEEWGIGAFKCLQEGL